MRVFIAGVDGYLGWALAQYLSARGHEIAGADMFYRRAWVSEMGSHSAIPIEPMPARLEAFRENYNRELIFRQGDFLDHDFVAEFFRDFQPDAVVHLGECPSAPYSMVDVQHTTWVQQNNVVGTLNILYAIRDIVPDAHLVKLGTMGEYGTPNIDIPEGFFEVEYRGRKDRLPFPRQAGSWYHWSKVHDSNNVMFACKIWGIRSTDIMQGVVFGTQIDEMKGDDRLYSRLDFDQSFGTAVNRFCCQAVIGHPLTLFGKGQQKRGFLPLRDSMQCLTIAIENPPRAGEYRVFNQFQEAYSVHELAHLVANVADEIGLGAEVRHIENPRQELEEHYFNPDHRHLLDLGYKPTVDVRSELKTMLSDLHKHRARIDEKIGVLIPDIRWDGTRKKSKFLPGL
jgi:UDP-sulfoquinovose synthase